MTKRLTRNGQSAGGFRIVDERNGLRFVQTSPGGDAAFWGTGGALYDELIRFANLPRSGLDKLAPVRDLFGYLAPKKDAAKFFKLARRADSHTMVRAAFHELAARGALSRQTEYRIDELLGGMPFSGRYRLHNMTVETRFTQRFPNLTSLCAYGLTSLVGTGLYDCIRRCDLEECDNFFWSPIRRGPRATYCCQRHAWRGSQRKRRPKPKKRRGRT